MISMQDYLADPCGSLSIPYWKEKSLVLPESMKIVHERDFRPGDDPLYEDTSYEDTRYFRLKHDLADIRLPAPDGRFSLTAKADTAAFAGLINACYDDIRVTDDFIASLTRTEAFCADLWLLIAEKATGKVVGGGIADFDREAGEMILEWIQVLPAYRRRGLGRAIVNELLFKMRETADFATVSGRVDSPSSPEHLYRACGFTGGDVWHILRLRRGAPA